MVATIPGVRAAADHGGTSSQPNRDNNDHEFDSHSLGTKAQIACSHGKTEIDATTEVRASVGTGDVHCYDGDYGATDWIGATRCTSLNWTTSRCDHYRIDFNTYYSNLSSAMWKSAGCHEVGHTSSVGHRTNGGDPNNNSCMRKYASADRLHYDSHDVSEINGDA